jgi:hypothetical protein
MVKYLCWKLMQWAQDYEVYRKFRESDDRPDVYATVSPKRGARLSVGSDGPDITRTFRFDVTVARGGILVTTRRYDAKKDETHEIINVIHEDDDSSKKIADIVSMEILKS